MLGKIRSIVFLNVVEKWIFLNILYGNYHVHGNSLWCRTGDVSLVLWCSINCCEFLSSFDSFLSFIHHLGGFCFFSPECFQKSENKSFVSLRCLLFPLGTWGYFFLRQRAELSARKRVECGKKGKPGKGLGIKCPNVAFQPHHSLPLLLLLLLLLHLLLLLLLLHLFLSHPFCLLHSFNRTPRRQQ